MEIWLDSVEVGLIEKAKQMGILHGVTTNPSIVAKAKQPLNDLLEKILQVQKGPVTVQVTAGDARKMVEQGEALVKFSPRIIVKVPVTGEGFKAIYALSEKKIPTMATAVFEINQVLLAAHAGATYIAPYFSPMCEADREGPEQLRAMLRMLDRYKFPVKLLGASIKSGEQVRECVEIGVHAVTLNKEAFVSFIQNHPETVKRVNRFAADWKTVKEQGILKEEPM